MIPFCYLSFRSNDEKKGEGKINFSVHKLHSIEMQWCLWYRWPDSNTKERGKEGCGCSHPTSTHCCPVEGTRAVVRVGTYLWSANTVIGYPPESSFFELGAAGLTFFLAHCKCLLGKCHEKRRLKDSEWRTSEGKVGQDSIVYYCCRGESSSSVVKEGSIGACFWFPPALC